MPRPIIATISHNALKNNLAITRHLAPTSRIWAVIKANAYGHGIKNVLKSLIKADGFALLNLDEAILIRHHGWDKPILLLEGFFEPDDLKIINQYSLTTTIHSQWQIKILEQSKLSSPVDIYLKINCGMNRLGFHPHEINKTWHQLQSFKNIGKLTLMSHFPTAESLYGVTESMQKIKKAAIGLKCQQSLANSAATLWHPNTHYDWIRPGIMLYGASPGGSWNHIAHTGLKPVMNLTSKVIAIQEIPTGATIGYTHHYRAPYKQRIGIVACGYADGYPRHAPSGTPIRVGEEITHTIGSVMMDMLAVDLTHCPQTGLGSPVELWGDNIKIDDIASKAGTVGYEIMCSLSQRVPIKIH
ncbi:alanine racemase [Candidatus Erwinia haradaeae]|uniref:Alanine racemase n=1 Tax=Candidatus Erwinia haradaeae TaxID=1922217 RepID=A0A803FSX8_9GAMM|nr:alanine racemase [Candidatus Erwinia haradaeae]VFP87282.1 Alanine racemase, catabolic [Candidatus Erwinia haradaeae]